MAAARTVFIDTALSNYASLAAQYDTDLFHVVLLDQALSASEQIQNWLNSNDASSADINVVSGSNTVIGLFTPRVVFVDPSVANFATVIAGIPGNVTVVVLDASRDGVQQIYDFLSANSGLVAAVDIISGLASVDVISHGSPGEVMLGSTVLSAANLANYSTQLAAIGSHLTAGADLMLYGCDVASGTIGQEFISALAAATGADVAASTDLTGSAAAGGDWVLEASTGTIDTAALSIAAYEGVLAVSSINSVKLSADTGVSSTDFITGVAEQTITGTFTLTNNSPPVIWVSADGGKTRTEAIITHTAGASSGSFSANVTLVTGANTSIQFWSGKTNNNEVGAAQVYKLDLTPTTTVSTIAFSNDSGSSATDFITNAAIQTLSGTLSATTTTGQVVRVSVDNGVNWQTASNVAGQNTFSLSGVSLGGSNTLKVRVEDAAGNAGPVRSQAFVLDNVPPTAGALSLSGLIDSGGTGDGMTNDRTFDLSLAGNEAASTVIYEASFNGGAFSSTAVPQTNLADGSYQFRARVTDVAGNTATTNTVSIQIDATAPNAPNITGFSDNSGSTLDTTTTDETPTLIITAEADATVEVFKGGVSVGTATQTAPHSGVYTFTSSILADGDHSFTTNATDAAGNSSSASLAQNVVVDTTLTAPIVALTNDSGNAGDGLTNDGELTLNTVDGDATRMITVDGTVVNSYDASILVDGMHTVSVVDTDGAGNTKNASVTFTLDTTLTIPTAALITDSGTAGDGLTNDAKLSLSTVDSDATRVITVNGTVVNSYDASSLADGKHTVSVVDTDGAGNTKNASATFTLDTTLKAPTLALTTDSGNAGDSLSNDAELSLNTVDSDAVRVITVDGTVVSSYDASALADGKHTVSVVDIDQAGNSKSASLVFTLDSEGPILTSGASARVAENIGENQIVYQVQATDMHAIAYQLGGTDANKFEISTAGVVTLKDNPNFESTNAYSFSVVATDAAGNRTDQAVSLEIDNVNEAPVASTVNRSTIENTPVTIQVADFIYDQDAGDKLALSLSSYTATLAWANSDPNAPMQLINPVTRAPVALSSLNVLARVSADGASVTLVPPAELDWLVTGQGVKATFNYSVTDAGGLTSSDSISLLMSGSTNDKGVNLNGGNGNDMLSGNATNNAEDVLQGANGNDTLSGFGGTDALYGGNGDDNLSGGAGIDYLYGDSGNDTLNGGTEADFIFGGKGNDILTGGTGADKFVFNPQNGNDRILDFKIAEGDKLFFADFFSTPMSAEAFVDKYVTDTGNDLLINLPGTSIVLVGVPDISVLIGALSFGTPT